MLKYYVLFLVILQVYIIMYCNTWTSVLMTISKELVRVQYIQWQLFYMCIKKTTEQCRGNNLWMSLPLSIHEVALAFSLLVLRMFLMKNSPALYDDRTSGPLAVYAKPSWFPISSQNLNFSGGTYSFTLRCHLVGWMYCPRVTQSTPELLRSVRIKCV